MGIKKRKKQKIEDEHILNIFLNVRKNKGWREGVEDNSHFRFVGRTDGAQPSINYGQGRANTKEDVNEVEIDFYVTCCVSFTGKFDTNSLFFSFWRSLKKKLIWLSSMGHFSSPTLSMFFLSFIKEPVLQ